MIQEVEVSAIAVFSHGLSSTMAITPDGETLYMYAYDRWVQYRDAYDAMDAWSLRVPYSTRIWRGIFKIKVQS